MDSNVAIFLGGLTLGGLLGGRLTCGALLVSGIYFYGYKGNLRSEDLQNLYDKIRSKFL